VWQAATEDERSREEEASDWTWVEDRTLEERAYQHIEAASGAIEVEEEYGKIEGEGTLSESEGDSEWGDYTSLRSSPLEGLSRGDKSTVTTIGGKVEGTLCTGRRRALKGVDGNENLIFFA